MTSIMIDRTDGLSSSTAIKGPCKAATTANITLYGEQTIDGVAIVTGDRVLVKDQTAGYENGIYVADTGQWRRSRDFNRTNDVREGTQVLVTDGSTLLASTWYVATANPVTIGTVDIDFNESVISPSELQALVDTASAAAIAATTAAAAAVAAAAAINTIAVTNRTAAKAVSPTIKSLVCITGEGGRNGLFAIRAGSQPKADPNEGVYMASNMAGYYLERLFAGLDFDIEWFGAQLDNSTDDTAAIQAAVDFASSFTNTPYSARAGIHCGPGKIFKTTGKISLNTPIRIRLESLQFHYSSVAGSAWFINELQPAGASSYWDIYMEGAICQPAGSAFPTTIAATGPHFMSIRAMTFSRVEVRQVLGFAGYAFELDGRGITYPSNNQIIQHNHFILGQIANNGVGIWMQSASSATSSVQGNRFDIQNIYQNNTNFADGDATYFANNSNTYYINAMDNEQAVGIDTWCSFNKWHVGFSGAPGTTLRLNGAAADKNRFEFTNNESTSIVINWPATAGNDNEIRCAVPNTLPSTPAVVSGVAQTNNFGCPVNVKVPMTGSGTYTEFLVKPDGTTLTLGTAASSGGVVTFPALKHGWGWKIFVNSGTLALSTALITAA